MKTSKAAMNLMDEVDSRLNEVLLLDATYVSMSSVETNISQIKSIRKHLMLYIKEGKDVSQKILNFVESFKCDNYGGLCGNPDCNQRHVKPSIVEKIKRFTSGYTTKNSNTANRRMKSRKRVVGQHQCDS